MNKTKRFEEQILTNLGSKTNYWHTNQFLMDLHYVWEHDDTEYADVFDLHSFTYIGRADMSKHSKNVIDYDERYGDNLWVRQHLWPIEGTCLYICKIDYIFYAPKEFEILDDDNIMVQSSHLKTLSYMCLTKNTESQISDKPLPWCGQKTVINFDFTTNQYFLKELLDKWHSKNEQ